MSNEREKRLAEKLEFRIGPTGMLLRPSLSTSITPSQAIALWRECLRLMAQAEEAERLRGALEKAAEESWMVKTSLMDLRDAVELSPQKEEWIQAKINQWIAGE